MLFTTWYLIAGGLLVFMALASSVLKRLPLTSAMFYLATGFLLSPAAAGLLNVDMVRDADLLERFTEIGVIVALFSAGLKLRLPLSDRRWRPAIHLASAGMLVTVGAVAAIGTLILGLPIGASILLGACLAPTDPVLASDVQVEHAHDAEQVPFALTGEAGLNDGTAFPFVMLGLGLLGLHELGTNWWRWIVVDLVWSIAGGLLIGTVCGSAVARLVIYLRRVHREAVGLDDFLALGLIALSYGLALLAHSYGFLAVFAAGLALRRVERENSGEPSPEEVRRAGRSTESAEDDEADDAEATDPARAPAYMAQAVLSFNERLERMTEVAIVLLLGAMLYHVTWRIEAVWLTAALFLVIRPAATFVSLIGTAPSAVQRGFMAWFGVRGVGSVYYLAYAIARGASGEAQMLADLTLIVVAASIVLHGISVTPLMKLYRG